MNADKHIVGICGSLNDDSRTRVALGTALDAAAAEGATTELVDLREFDLPPYDPNGTASGDAQRLQEIVAGADGLLLGTPNYHGSYTGTLKNALDYCGRDEFADTCVGLITVAGGSFPTPALTHLRAVCRTLDAWVLPTQVAVPRSRSTVRGGQVVDGDVQSRLQQLGVEIAEYAGMFADPGLADCPTP